MKFEELLKKYQDGTATPEERAAVEEELEKVRLIEEYLAAEDTPLPLPEISVAGEVKAVQRTITRRTRRTAAAVVAGVLAVMLLLQYVLLPLLNRRIYDREDYEVSEGFSEYRMTMDVFTQLFLPQYDFYGCGKETSGFGRWTLKNTFWGLPGQYVAADFTVTCGFLNTESENFWRLFPAVNLFDQDISHAGDDALARLDDSISVSGAVSFTENLTLEEVLAFRQQARALGVDVIAAAISRQTGHTMFLRLEGGVIGWSDSVNKDYPHLYLGYIKPDDSEVLQQHLISQLQYMADHSSISRKLDPHVNYSSFLKEAKSDEITYCGVWVTGTGAELLSLYDTGIVSQIWAQEAHISLH